MHEGTPLEQQPPTHENPAEQAPEQQVPIEPPETPEQAQSGEQPQSVVAAPPPTPFEQGLGQPQLAEQTQPPLTDQVEDQPVTPETDESVALEQSDPETPGEPQPEASEGVQEKSIDRVAKIAEFNSLFARVRNIVEAGHAGDAATPEGLLKANFQQGPISIEYDNTVEGVKTESMVTLQSDELTVDRTVTTQEGSKTLSVTLGKSNNKGKLLRHGTSNSESLQSVELNNDHIRDVVETVMAKLQTAAETKELDVSKAVDKEVYEILGL